MKRSGRRWRLIRQRARYAAIAASITLLRLARLAASNHHFLRIGVGLILLLRLLLLGKINLRRDLGANIFAAHQRRQDSLDALLVITFDLTGVLQL